MYKKEIFLEIDANLHQPIPSMEADSNSRAIRFYLTSNYAPLNLKDKKVIFKAVKPDSTDIVNDCEIIDVEKGIVETKVTKQLNAVPGRVNCQLSIIGANDYVLKTKKFAILVDSKLTESGIVSSREYKTLENALSEVHEINKNFEQVNAKINEVATKGTTVEVIEEVTKEEIERQIADGTITHLMIEDGSVTPEKTSFYDEIATQKNLLKNAEFDYMGNNQNTVKKAIDSSIDWVLGEVNTAHHEGQHITATDTIEGHAKSAILKGNTLVNVNKPVTLNVNRVVENGWQILTTWSTSYNTWQVEDISLFKPDTTYLIRVEVVENTLNDIWLPMVGHPNAVSDYNVSWNIPDLIFESKEVGVKTSTFKTRPDFTNVICGLRSATSGNEEIGRCLKFRVLIVEYQEGMENWDIPYFEGVQSVKMPVLKATGKNLINVPDTDKIGQATDITNAFKMNTDYTFSYHMVNNSQYETRARIDVYNIDGTVSYYGAVTPPNTIKTTSQTFRHTKPFYYVSVLALQYFGVNASGASVSQIQLEEGSATEYEPYKSNILTCNEDVELRGIGNVKDELSLITGELTQRIGEVVLNGSEKWTKHSTKTNVCFYYYYIDNLYGNNWGVNDIINDKLEQVALGTTLPGESWEDNKITAIGGYFDGRHGIGLFKSIATVSELQQYLQQNPITVQYKLATESIKTVDLSDNVVYSYDEVTHYDCSSEEGSLVPTLSVDVPTNLSALVSRQRATIETQKEQIQTLEVENEQLIAQNEIQDEDIALNQDAINFMLFASEMLADDNKTKGVNTMAAYLANQILKGKLDYSLVVSRYPQFKEDIDTILILEGEENLIK